MVEVFRDGSVLVHTKETLISVRPEILARIIADGIEGWRKTAKDVECLN